MTYNIIAYYNVYFLQIIWNRRCFDGAETVEGIIEGLSKEDGDDKFVASTLKVSKMRHIFKTIGRGSCDILN